MSSISGNSPPPPVPLPEIFSKPFDIKSVCAEGGKDWRRGWKQWIRSFLSPETTRRSCVVWRPLLNLTVLSFFSQFPGSACGSPPVSTLRELFRSPPGPESLLKCFRHAVDADFSGSPGSTRSSAAGPNCPPTEARLGGPATSCRGLSFRRTDPSLPRVQRTVAFRHRTVPAEIGMEWRCVCPRVCFESRLWDRHTRNGAWGPSQRLFSDGSSSGPAAALLGRFGDSATRSAGSARPAGGEGPRRPRETRSIPGVRTMNSALWIGPAVWGISQKWERIRGNVLMVCWLGAACVLGTGF